MEDDVQAMRKNLVFLRESYRPEDAFKQSAGLKVSTSVAALIRQLAANNHSQGAIADILNEKGLLRNGRDLWKQYHVSRYFKTHNIKAVHSWRGGRSSDDEPEGV
ncbi:hypothetical protein SAMN05216299_1354 [Nitrosospira sp. Nsp14]|uniref:hypothetical protein n=1 Tax=Nitrosospira sp. Nsp14 TaxID=1855333 RepID=UPI0008E77CE6|nr:hypothetical protein [Nitrosospira sp. Nsp14]SFH61239.1 hypothetical protein SAMN05216299_1354 [Nitrosospira sp. Nsp14]